MMQTLLQNHKEKDAIVFSLSNQNINKLVSLLTFIALLVLPFQFGKHFWPSFSYIIGQRVDYLSPTVYLSDICIVGLFLLVGKRFLYTIGVWFWASTLFLSLGIFFSLSPLAGWYGLLKVIEMVFFGWIIFQQKQTLFPKLFWTFTIGVLLEGTLGLSEVIHQGSLNGVWYYLGERSFTAGTPGIANASIHGQLILRPYATFPHPNVFAGYVVIALLFFLSTAVTTNKKLYQLVSLIMVILGAAVLILTLSRVAFVVGVVLAMTILLLKLKRRAAGIFSALCIVGLNLFFSDPVLSGRFFDISSYTESLGLRLLLQQAALTMAVAHPILGVGLNNFLIQLPFFIQGHVLFGFLQPVHSLYLLVLSETGIIGLSAFLLLLVISLLSSLKDWHSQHEFFPLFSVTALGAIVLIGCTDHYFLSLQQGQLLFALVLGLCLKSDTIPLWPFIKNLQRIRSTKS